MKTIPPMRNLLFFTVLLSLAMVMPCLALEKKVERHSNGKIKRKYYVDGQGRKHGTYYEYYSTGKTRIKAKYSMGKLHGKYREYYPNGQIKVQKGFRRGKVSGHWVTVDQRGQPELHLYFSRGKIYIYPQVKSRKREKAHPRSKEEIKKAVKKLQPKDMQGWNGSYRFSGKKFKKGPQISPPHKAGELTKTYRQEGMRQVMVYRYLCQIPYQVTLDDRLHRFCQHGAVVLAEVGRLTHTPRRPSNMDKTFFQLGYRGTSKSNISARGNIVTAVDSFMSDSDSSNIRDLGHRRWILNPTLKRLDFGLARRYVLMWATDSSRRLRQSHNTVLYPAKGYFPVEYFRKNRAWSILLNKRKYPRPASKNDVEIKMWILGDNYSRQKKLSFNHFSVSKKDYGHSHSISFRPRFPRNFRLQGSKILVSAKIKRSGKVIFNLTYLVDFFSLKDSK